jgi:apolipoprotein N-acyltransferase
VGNHKWDPAVRDSIVTALLGHTEALAREHREDLPDLVIWPETAIPARLPREPRYRAMVEGVVDTNRIVLLAGFPDGEPLPRGGYRFTNSAGLLLPGRGMVERYDKRHLVPFSEYFPLPILNRYDFGQSNFSAGSAPGIFRETGVPFGLLICFESIFPAPARELTRLGAGYLVNITNDQWFGNSAAPEQHFRMNVLRAIENRRSIARAANTGISAVITPYGSVAASTPTFVPALLVEGLEVRYDMTFYARHGDWVLLACAVGLSACAGWGLRRRGR